MMTSQKPYLIRAIYQWLLDNNETPYLLVDTTVEGVDVPDTYIQNNKIVLNIAPDATDNLQIDNDWLHFFTRFSGVATELFIPTTAVIGIYGRDSNQGMFFSEDTFVPPPTTQPPSTETKRPSLKVIK